MQCPRCSFPIRTTHTTGVEIDHCDRCGGTFFDPGEAEALFGSQVAPSVWGGLWVASNPRRSRLRCPRDGTTMNVHDVAFGGHQVEVDVCPHCIGMWLDQNEGAALAHVVGNAVTTQQRKLAGLDRPGAASYLFQLLSGLPVEVWNPVRRRPVLVIGLVALLLIAFVAQLGTAPSALAGLMLVPTQVLAGRDPWSLVSYGFLHGGWLHLLGNLYFLWVFGDNVEDRLGRRNFTLVYLASIVAGAALHLAVHPTSSIPVVGASGAIAGLMGAYMVLFPKVQVWVVFFFMRFRLPALVYLGLWIALQVLGQLGGGPGVAWMAHIGGFVTGSLMARSLARRVA